MTTPVKRDAATPAPTRDRIVEVALRLFSERGTAAVGVREVADAAGVTVPGLYYHFASKADLIRAVFDANAGRSGADPDPDAVLRKPGPVAERVIAQARREFKRMHTNREFLRLMHRQDTLGDADARAASQAMSLAWRARWADVIAGSDDLAPGADVDAAADAIATFLWGLFVESFSTGEVDVSARISRFAHMMGSALARPARKR